MKKNMIRGIGIVVAASSFFTLVNPYEWYNHMPVIFALGCIIYIMADKFGKES